MPTVNFRDVQPFGEFKPLDAGTYPVEITNVKIEKSKKSDQEMLVFEYSVLQSHETSPGRKVFERMGFGSGAIEFTQQKLMAVLLACGYDADQLATTSYNIDEEFCADLIGYEIAVTVKIKPAEGEYGPQNQVTAYAAFSED